MSRPVDGQLQQGTKPVDWIRTSVPRIRANFDPPFLNIRVQPPAITPYTLTENNMTPLKIDLRETFRLWNDGMLDETVRSCQMASGRVNAIAPEPQNTQTYFVQR